ADAVRHARLGRVVGADPQGAAFLERAAVEEDLRLSRGLEFEGVQLRRSQPPDVAGPDLRASGPLLLRADLMAVADDDAATVGLAPHVERVGARKHQV